jgi:sortase A
MSRAGTWIARLLLFGGCGLLLWTVVVWQWQDPFTALYTSYEQRLLSQRLSREFAAYEPARLTLPRAVATGASRLRGISARQLDADAALLDRRAGVGQPIGRIKVPRMGLNMVLLNGTDESTLAKGPGRDLRSHLPGQGQLVYVAGHRTTYLAPFAHIDTLRKGDRITIEMPYATFLYEVTRHRIVPAGDLAVLRTHGHEALALQACHPRFFATDRYIAYAVPIKVTPRRRSAVSSVSLRTASRG